MYQLMLLLNATMDAFRIGGSRKLGFKPYRDKACSLVYNLLFCDKLHLFRKVIGAKPEGAWATLLAKVPYVAALTAIAEDQSQESRARLVAYNRLRELNQPVPERKLLGVIIEVGMEAGLDVLATYPDGSVRYINHKETMSVYEPVPTAWMPVVRRLMSASQAAMEQIGPWKFPRIAPPTQGMIRMSFLGADGLYFGQGVLVVMDADPIGKPIVAESVALLKLVAAADAKALPEKD